MKYYEYFDWMDLTYTEKEIASVYMMCQGNFQLALQNLSHHVDRQY